LSPLITDHTAHPDTPPTQSVIISVGSPALAAYSLVLTALNARVVYQRAKGLDYGDRTAVARALISLQQIPLELTENECFLDFMATNSRWRREIGTRLNRKNAWSIAAAASVAWVVMAFIFTLIDSFTSLNDTGGPPSEGLSVGTLWLWLLCLVVGWLWVPTFTHVELGLAIGHANMRTESRFKRWAKGLKMSTIQEPPEEREVQEELVHSEDAKDIEEGTDPGADLPDLPLQAPAESHQHPGHFGAGSNSAANQSIEILDRSAARSSTASIHLGTDMVDVLFIRIHEDKLGSLNRDELRLPATFNYSRLMRFLVLVDDVFRALDKLSHKKDEVSVSKSRLIRKLSQRFSKE
jgi:hypothetical protein